MPRDASTRSILDHIGTTPLVALERIGRDLPVPVLAKCEHMNPGGSVKDRIARAIVDDAERRGVLRPGGTLIEATAGNTGMGLAMVAAIRGYALVCVMPEKMSVDKRTALAALGAKVVITPNAAPDTPDHFQTVARRLAEENGWFLTDQFASEANVRAHEETTGPEILEQATALGLSLGAFVSGVGTGGTITGVARFLRRRSANTRIVLADPIGSGLARWVSDGVVGPSAPFQVEGIGSAKPPSILDRSVIDAVESVSDEESFAMTRRLWKEEGLFVGGSAGTAVVAALRVARVARSASAAVAVVLPDSWDRYLSKDWVAA
jgi:cysteine synthase